MLAFSELMTGKEQILIEIDQLIEKQREILKGNLTPEAAHEYRHSAQQLMTLFQRFIQENNLYSPK